MAGHTVTDKGWRRPPAEHTIRTEVLQLGWPHFWLLIGILGGMLALVGLVFAAHLASL